MLSQGFTVLHQTYPLEYKCVFLCYPAKKASHSRFQGIISPDEDLNWDEWVSGTVRRKTRWEKETFPYTSVYTNVYTNVH